MAAFTRIMEWLAKLWLGLSLAHRLGAAAAKGEVKDEDRANADAIRDRADAVPRPGVLRADDTRGYRD